MVSVQIPNIVLPTISPLGTEIETIADIATHTSLSLDTVSLQEKVIQVYATNPAGLAAPLQVFLDLAPSDVVAAYVQLGVAPVLTFVVTGSQQFAWTMHSEFVRIRVVCPAWAAGAWAVQVVFQAKTV